MLLGRVAIPQKGRLSQREYYQAWYARNRDVLAKKRASRYRSNPGLREKISERSRRRALAIRLKRFTRKLEMLSDLPLPRSRRPVVNRGEIYYHSGILAHVLGVRATTIALWERKGIMPVTCFWHNGARMYTARQIDIVSKASKAVLGIPRGADRGLFYTMVKNEWDKIGIGSKRRIV